jgi:CelD/BcsL family acetyltransferase involved in cellulose biosynthesis
MTGSGELTRRLAARAEEPDAAPSPRGLSVEVSFDVAEARATWAAIEDPRMPFQRLAWLAPWYRRVAPRIGASPVFVTVRDASAPQMFFPLCLRRWRGLRTIEFAGFDVSDYNAPLVAEGFDPSAGDLEGLWREILRALPAADLVRFERIPERILGREISAARLGWLRPMDLGAWMLDLPETVEDYENRVIVSKVRKENRRKTKRLQEKAGDLVLERARTPEEADVVLDALRRQRGARFGDDNNLDQPCYLAFYRDVIHANLGGFAELWALKAGERILATQFALRGPQAYLLIMHAFDAAIEGGSTGIVALDQMVKRRIELGDRHFDFTIGNETYKLQFGVRRVTLFSGICPVSAMGRAFLFAHAATKRGRAAFSAWRAKTKAAPAIA